MIDHFALLHEPRRPWLDPDSLKARFLALSSDVHPDRVHGAPEAERLLAQDRYAELNVAYNCLREPKARLLHLLELEMGRRPKEVQSIPAPMMELFMQVGRVCREVDAFLGERAKVTSPLLKARMFENAMELTDKLRAVQQVLNEKRELLESHLSAMNAAWENAAAVEGAGRAARLPLDQLEKIYRIFSFLTRWSSQLHERVVCLSF